MRGLPTGQVIEGDAVEVLRGFPGGAVDLIFADPLDGLSSLCHNVSMADQYRHNRGSVVLINYHLIWTPRRRRKVLVGPVARRLEQLLRERAAELSVQIDHLAIQPDHLHLFVSAPPGLSVSQIVFRLKGYTARVLRQEFPSLRRLPSMWTTAYFASTAGNVSQETIRRYIEAQSTRD